MAKHDNKKKHAIVHVIYGKQKHNFLSKSCYDGTALFIVKYPKMLSFSLVAEAIAGLIYHRPSGENFSFLQSNHSLSLNLVNTRTSITYYVQLRFSTSSLWNISHLIKAEENWPSKSYQQNGFFKSHQPTIGCTDLGTDSLKNCLALSQSKNV